jgi:predicted esterase
MRASSAAITDSTDNAIHYIYTLPQSVQPRAAEVFVAGSRVVEQTMGVLVRAMDGTVHDISELVKSNLATLDDAVQMVETAVAYAVRGIEAIDG